MIVSGVDTITAKTMYFAVWWGGPRWEERVVRNNALPQTDNYKFDAAVEHVICDVGSPGANASNAAQRDVIEGARRLLEERDLSNDAIEALAEAAMPKFG